MKSRGWSARLFKREQRSLFGEILDWMLTPLLLLWPISLALTWLVAQGLANKPFDRALVYNVQALAQQVKLGPDKRVQFNLPQPASELLRADETDLVYYQEPRRSSAMRWARMWRPWSPWVWRLMRTDRTRESRHGCSNRSRGHL